jgi:hypothetical protein
LANHVTFRRPHPVGADRFWAERNSASRPLHPKSERNVVTTVWEGLVKPSRHFERRARAGHRSRHRVTHPTPCDRKLVTLSVHLSGEQPTFLGAFTIIDDQRAANQIGRAEGGG